MKSLRDTIINFIQSEETRKDMYNVVKPLQKSIYNEMYPYILFICIYIVILTFIILANLMLLLRVLNNLGNFYISTSPPFG